MRKASWVHGWATSLVLAAPISAHAQDSAVTPEALDFGQVEVGESVTVPVTIRSTDPYTPLTVYSFSFCAPSDPDCYHWTDYNHCTPERVADHPPREQFFCSNDAAEVTITATTPADYSPDLFPGEEMIVDVTYTPTVVGPAPAVTFAIDMNDHDDPFVLLPIRAEAIEPLPEPPTPEESIAELIAFFDDAVAGGGIVGTGHCSHARAARARWLRNMLVAAQGGIEWDMTQAACYWLRRADSASDGTVPDLVSGDDAAELNASIVDLMPVLGCAWP